MNNERIINYSLLIRISMWNYNYSQEERLSKELFAKYFGNRMGEHYYDKWISTCEQRFMKMIAYFGQDSKEGQTFCDMVAEQIQKYEQRLKR